MGTKDRGDAAGIIKNLTENGPLFNVWQAVWIAENITKKNFPDRKDFLLDNKGLRFRPYEEYEYPPRDIKEITFESDEFNFVLTFFGLYGINSPLPRCYHEQIVFQKRTLGTGEIPLQNFLDIFNNRIYWLYYQAWKKYRFHLFINDRPDNKITERIKSFMGKGFFSSGQNSYLSDYTLLKFSGILSQRVRNKNGLNIILSHIFPEFDISVREFVSRWVELSDIPNLGDSSLKLGQNAFIGKSVKDFMSRICIEIGPVSFEEYLEFLPGTPKAIKLTELLNLYLNDGLEFDLSFKIKGESIIGISWDDNRIRLGSTLWLGKPKTEFTNVYLHYEEVMN